MKIVEIRFDAEFLDGVKNDILHQQHVMQALRKLGVPLVGTLWMRTASSGELRLRFEEDIDNSVYIWTWYSDQHARIQGDGWKLSTNEEGTGKGYTYTVWSNEDDDDF